MKIVRSDEMGRIESLAYAAGAEEAAFMDNAGLAIADYTMDYLEAYPHINRVILLCGKGNNGGDAYVAGRHLLQHGMQCHAIQVGKVEEGSELLRINANRFYEAGGKRIDTVPLTDDALMLDGLFGTGFHGQAQEPYASLIRSVNSSPAHVLAIDIPSGLNGNDGHVEGAAIYAEQTLCLGLPKHGLFSRTGWERCGKLAVIPFGLDPEYINAAEATATLLTQDELPSIPKLNRCQHKYEAGFVQVLGGSMSMPGAGVLSAHAALRSGAGICHLLHPRGVEAALSNAPAEIIRIAVDHQDIQSIADHLNHAGSAVLGPGLGKGSTIHTLIRRLLPLLAIPVVIDADALNALAATGTTPPAGSLLTPHEGEMSRLLGNRTCDIRATQNYAAQHNVFIILKGAPTHIFSPDGHHWICPLGNPGMATAGSGDVLSGVLAALLAKGMETASAARLGVYLHALAGDCAESGLTAYCMLASDITEHLPQAFQLLSS